MGEVQRRFPLHPDSLELSLHGNPTLRDPLVSLIPSDGLAS